jgi:hypothetical protein
MPVVPGAILGRWVKRPNLVTYLGAKRYALDDFRNAPAARRRTLLVSSQQKGQGKQVFKNISLAVVLISMASVASAATGGGDGCIRFWFFEYCPVPPPSHPAPLKAPEIDPASALAGLSLLAGGLAVLCGRRIKATA